MSAPKEDVRWTYEAVCPSLRFEAAKAAMQGLVSAGHYPDFTPDRIAAEAVGFADALLAALAKPEEKEANPEEKAEEEMDLLRTRLCESCRHFASSPASVCLQCFHCEKWEAKR